MTRDVRVPGASLSLKDSRETLASRPTSMTQKRSAQLVVCNYVDAWYSDLDDAGKVAEAKELFDILGISEDQKEPRKSLSWKQLKDLDK